MSIENPLDLINPVERNNYIRRLYVFLQGVIPTGAVSDETEAERLYKRLLNNEPLSRDYIEKILGQLGNSDDRGSLYH